MPNYEMKFSVSEAANVLDVEKNLIKKWAHLFKDYLEPPANPPKGVSREFCEKDLRILSYISIYWEEDPDLKEIEIGLNREDYYEEVDENFIDEFTPLFRELPDNLNEEMRHGAIIGGMAGSLGVLFDIADSFKTAGDILVAEALSKDEVYDLLCPIVYNYRHATELYLKAIITKHKKNHNLIWLLTEFKKLLKSKFDTELPRWFEDIVIAFNDFDPAGTTFRYGEECPGETWVDVAHMKKILDRMAISFQRIRRFRG